MTDQAFIFWCNYNKLNCKNTLRKLHNNIPATRLFFFPAGLHALSEHGGAAQRDPRDVCHSDGNFTERFNTAKFKLPPEYCMIQRLSGGQRRRRRQTKRHRRTSHGGNFLLRTIRYEDLRGETLPLVTPNICFSDCVKGYHGEYHTSFSVPAAKR